MYIILCLQRVSYATVAAVSSAHSPTLVVTVTAMATAAPTPPACRVSQDTMLIKMHPLSAKSVHREHITGMCADQQALGCIVILGHCA